MTARSRKSPAAKVADWTNEQRRQIAERAYYYFVERGKQPGHQLEDWLRAEAELASAASVKTPKKPRRAPTAKA